MQTIDVLGRRAEVLLVEDEYGDVLLMREALRRAKMHTNLTVARDGEEALRALRREGAHAKTPRPDLILLDLNLPRLDGRGVLAAIKADPELQPIPVVVMSSSKAEVDVLKSYQLNANGYIVKPVEFERLEEIVASLESFWFTAVSLAPSPAFGDANVA